MTNLDEPPKPRRYPFCNVETTRSGTEDGLDVLMGHDSYMRFSFASWHGPRDSVRFPFAEVKPEEWRKETERLNAEREANYKRMEDMREQIKAAESIRKDAERIAEWNRQDGQKRDAPSL